MTVRRRRRKKKADHKKTEKALKLTWKNTHTKKKRTINSFRITKKHPIREPFFLSSFRESPFFAGEVIFAHDRARLRKIQDYS